MEKINIVFIDHDYTYLEPLIEKFVSEIGSEKTEISVITEEESFQNYFSVMRSADIMLINKSMYTEKLSMHDIKNIFFLCETEDSDALSIFKYTSTKEIFEYVMNYIDSGIKSKMTDVRKSMLIGIYSPAGGCGKTTVALAFAKALANAGKRTLYVCGEDIQNFECLLNCGGYLESGFRNDVLESVALTKSTIERYIENDGFYYLRPVKDSFFSEKYTFNDFVRVSIMAKKLFDYVVFDMPSSFSADVCGLIQQADMNVIVTKQDKMSVKKLDKLLSIIDYKSSNKFTFICNMYDASKENFLLGDYMTNKCVVRVALGICNTERTYEEMAADRGLAEYIKYII